MISIRFLLPCVDIKTVLVSVVFVLHIPVATVSLLLSNVDFKTMTPGTVVSIGNPSRTTMYGNIAAACNEAVMKYEILYSIFHGLMYLVGRVDATRPTRHQWISLAWIMEGLVLVVYLPIHDPSTKDWQAIPQL